MLKRVVSDGIIAPGYDEGVVGTLAAKKRGSFPGAGGGPGVRAAGRRRPARSTGCGSPSPRRRTADPGAAGPAVPDAAVGDSCSASSSSGTPSRARCVMRKDGMTIGIAPGSSPGWTAPGSPAPRRPPGGPAVDRSRGGAGPGRPLLTGGRDRVGRCAPVPRQRRGSARTACGTSPSRGARSARTRSWRRATARHHLVADRRRLFRHWIR